MRTLYTLTFDNAKRSRANNGRDKTKRKSKPTK